MSFYEENKKNSRGLNIEALFIADKLGIENIKFKYDIDGISANNVIMPICEFTVIFNRPYSQKDNVTVIEINSECYVNMNYSVIHKINLVNSNVKEGDMFVVSSSDPYSGIIIPPKGKTATIKAVMDNGSTWSTKISN